MKFCSHCGKEIMDEAVVCPGCGCGVQERTVENPYSEEKAEVSKTAVVLGAVGIAGAVLLAIVGHICSIIAIILGIIDCTKNRKPTGLILGIVGEVLSVFSSLIGAAIVASMF